MDKSYVLGRLRQRIADMYSTPYKKPDLTLRGRLIFEERSYRQWAAWEWYYRIVKANDLYAVSENFVKEMDTYACLDHPKVRIFSIAYDVATDLNDFLLSINTNPIKKGDKL